MSKKILYLIDNLGCGGAQKSVKNIIENLNPDYTPYLCALRPSDPEIDIKCEKVILPHHKYNPLSFLSVIKICKEKKIDIIHAQLSKSNLTALVINMITKKKVIIHERGDVLLKGFIFSLFRLFYRFLSPYSSVTITNSKATASGIKKFNKTADNRIKVVYNGIDFESFEKISSSRNEVLRSFNIDPSKTIIGHVGRLHILKGVDILVKSFGKLHTQHPNTHLMIVGDGPDMNKLNTLVKNLKLESFVTFTGYCENTSEIMSAIDIGVMCSRAEGFGRVAVEFMRAKTALIVSGKGGLSELVSDNKTGLIASRNEPEEICKCITTMINDENLRKRFIEKAFIWSENFTIEKHCLELNKIYNDIISGKY